MKRILAALGYLATTTVAAAMLLIGTILWLASWGLMFGDAKKDRSIVLKMCHEGTAYAAVFMDNPSWGTLDQTRHEMLGSPVRARLYSMPGAVFGIVYMPFCPGESPERVADYYERYRQGLVRPDPEAQATQDALRKGYEDAEAERRKRGGRVEDDQPEEEPEDEPETPETTPDDAPSDDDEEKTDNPERRAAR